MPLNRREFIGRMATLAGGAAFLPPIVFRAGPAFGQIAPDPASAQRNRLVVIFQQGGNDGLNTVVPRGNVSGAPRLSIYQKVRPSIKYAPEVTLPLDLAGDADQLMGFNPKLTRLHSLYRQGRVAVVQGVDYPKHSYSHFVSTDIWQSGQPEEKPDSGWMGRHLDRVGIPDGELRGLGIGTELPLVLRGEQRQGVEVESVNKMRFLDGTNAAADARHAAFAQYGDHPAEEPLRRFVGEQAERTVALVDLLETVKSPPSTVNYLANSLLTARTLLEEDLGVECIFVWHAGGQGVGSYDTHTGQVAGHEKLLTDLDQAIEVFLFGTLGGAPVGTPPIGALPAEIASRTLVMTVSEFGRRIGENGSGALAGTDHGASAPLFVIGPQQPAGATRLAPGLHGEHPGMGSVALPADNLGMTTELRRVFQSVLQEWLGNPDPAYAGKFDPLPGLFQPA